MKPVNNNVHYSCSYLACSDAQAGLIDFFWRKGWKGVTYKLLEKRRRRGDLIEAYKVITGKEAPQRQWAEALSINTKQGYWGHGHKLYKQTKRTLNSASTDMPVPCLDNGGGWRQWSLLPHRVVKLLKVLKEYYGGILRCTSYILLAEWLGWHHCGHCHS